jgi:hypothetical protein
VSELRANTISDAAGTGPVTLTKQAAAKVWVNWTSAGVVNDSLNISSVTDSGAGDFTLNFSSNLSATTYAPTMSWESTYSTTAVIAMYSNTTKTTSALDTYSYNTGAGTNTDCPEYGAAIFGDLA